MIVIDKSNNAQTLYLTLSENAVYGPTATYTIEFFNFYTNVTYEYDLITTTYSNSRYDRMTFNLSDELSSKVTEEGLYKYIVYEWPDGSNQLEIGMAKVINTGTSQSYFEIAPLESDDDYITYG